MRVPSFAVLALTSLLTAVLAAGPAFAAELIRSPGAPPAAADRRPVIFLGGSIEMGNAPDWQAAFARDLDDLDVVLLNPRREDWNPAWKPVAEDPNFRAQVEWELAALERSDIIVMYLAPGTQSPISLLELGLYARSGRLVVLAPEGFWRKGNVDITAQRYGVRRVSSLEQLEAVARERATALAAERLKAGHPAGRR